MYTDTGPVFTCIVTGHLVKSHDFMYKVSQFLHVMLKGWHYSLPNSIKLMLLGVVVDTYIQNIRGGTDLELFVQIT